MNRQLVMSLISPVLDDRIKGILLSKKIDVSRYATLLNQIPDNVLVIDEVFPEDELDIINERFEPYLKVYNVFPFLGITGGCVIAIGYGSSNTGKIYYYDFDFGIFELDATIEEFLAGLKP